MNEKVIEKIADELGIAVGTAGDFIADMLPQYAALQIMDELAFVVPLLLVCIAAIVAIVICITLLRKKDYDWEHRVDCFLALGTAVVLLVMFIVAFWFSVVDIVGWYMFPEAMLLDMAMEAVGC